MNIDPDLKWTLEDVPLSKNIDGVMHRSDILRAKLTILNQGQIKATILDRVNSLVDVFNELGTMAHAQSPDGQELYHTILISPHTHTMMRMVFGGLPSLSVQGVSIRPCIIFGGEVSRIQYAFVENSIVASLTRAGMMCDAMNTAWFAEHAIEEDFAIAETLMIEHQPTGYGLDTELVINEKQFQANDRIRK